MTEEASRTRKTELYKTNRIFALFLLVLGIVFIAIPKKIAAVIPYFLFSVLLLNSLIATVQSIKAKKKAERIVYAANAVISITISVLMVVFRKRSSDVVAILMAIHTVKEILDLFFEIAERKEEKKKRAGKILSIVIHAILLIELILELGKSVPTHVVIYGMLFLSQGVTGIYMGVKREMGGSILKQILLESYTEEILSGLLIVVAGASVLLPLLEPSIHSFGDGLWYSFMLVTTIGFGDMTAATPAGRLISVVVGIYGIVEVALITSIFVNLFNERKNKEREREEKEQVAEKKDERE